MLKEGCDVRNVTTIVGLRAYVAKSNILPEQTLGRGLRRMYFGSDMPETVSVMGTAAFMGFVESLKTEAGVDFEHKPIHTREIGFKTMLDAEVHHTIQLDGAGPADYRSVVGFFARQLLKELRLVGGYDILYPKAKAFMGGHLFASFPE